MADIQPYRSNRRDVVVVAIANLLLKLTTKGYRVELRKVLMGGFVQAISQSKEGRTSESLPSEARRFQRLEDLVDELKEREACEFDRANQAETKLQAVKELRDELREKSEDWHWDTSYRNGWAGTANKISAALDD